MNRVRIFAKTLLLFTVLACACAGARAQGEGRRRAGADASAGGRLTGVYRIDTAASDRLYSVVAGASSNLPFGEQQRFFLDLSTRLTPPAPQPIHSRSPWPASAVRSPPPGRR